MALPYRVENLDDVPEPAKELYEQNDDGYVLPVEGVKTEEEIGSLERAYERVKKERAKLREKAKIADRVTEEDIEELEQLRARQRELEEKKAAEEGKLDELRAKWKEETAAKVQEKEQEIERRDRVIEQLAVTNELRSAIAEAGVKKEYHRAVELLLKERGPTVRMDDGTPIGVFPDEVHGDKPITEFVEEWAETDEAQAYMPPSNAGGGGGTGSEGKPVKVDKPYSEMSVDEKAAYLEEKYGQEMVA